MDNIKKTTAASDFTTVALTAEIARSADETWLVVGKFSDTGKFLPVTNKTISGTGDLGSIRQIGEEILEVLVGISRHSYAYAQVAGPMAPYQYHGCIVVEETGESTCRVIYTLSYNEALLDEERKRQERERISKRFQDAVDAMKKAVENVS